MTKKLYLLLAGVAFCFSLVGQTEAEVLSQANKLFKNEKYVAATPLYLRLLSLSPKNSDYNFRYGTCLLFNADKKQEALRYLKFAADDPKIDPLAFYFLGKAYQVNYLFNDAVRSYDKFAVEADPKVKEDYPTLRLIETCQNGRKLLMNYSEMIVFEKKEIEAEKFFRLYNLDDIGGNIIVTADYQSKLDKKNGHVPLIYFGKGASEIFYSSYGESGTNGKDIYRKRREPTGAWGKAELLKGSVNTKYDEDYCYKSQDGQFLYFSSKGHNSMGGYDVFRSKYDESSDSFGEPENMDFAVSSPDDDIFFLVDAKNENGYFASARQSEVGKLYVYKIRVDKLPTQLSIIAGRYESKITNTPPKLKVQVENPAGQIVGVFESDPEGQIILSFPTGGQYKYKMNLQGSSEVFTANVNVPFKRNIKPIRQSFMHFKEDDKEVVRVLDRFDEAVSEKDDIMAALFAEKAKLDPNSDKFDLKGLLNQKEEQRILAEVGADGWSLSEVATELEGKARAIREMENRAGDTEKKAANLIDEEIQIIKKLNIELAQNAEAYRTAEVNSMSRQNLLTESKELLAQKAESEDKIQDLLDINRKVQENLVLYKDLKLRAGDWEKKGAELQNLLLEDKNAEALQLIALNKVIINSAITDTVEDYQTVTTHEISKLNKDLTAMNSLKFNYETSSKDLRNNIDYLEGFLMQGKAENPAETKENIVRKKKDLVVIHQEIKNIEETVKTKRVYKESLTDELSEYKELDNSPMPNRLVQMQTAKDNYLALQNTPQQKEANYLAEVIQDIEDGNLATTDPVENGREAMSPTELLELVNPSFNAAKNKIEQNEGLSEAEKATQLEKLEQLNAALFAEQIQKTNTGLAVNPNDQALQTEKESLETLLASAQQKADEYQVVQEVEQSKLIAKTIDETYVGEAIDNTYDDVKKHLDEDSNIDQKAKLNSLNELDQAFADRISKRKQELNELLAENPNKKPQYDKEIEVLDDLLASKEADVAERTSTLANLENVAVLTPAESAFSKMSPREQEQTILNELDPNYVRQKEFNDNISSPSLTDLQAEIALDETMVQSLNSKLEDLDPINQKAKIKTIQRIVVDTEVDINKNKQAIEEIEAANLAVTNPVESEFSKLSTQEQETFILAEVNENYLNQKQTFDAINSPSVIDLQREVSADEEIVESLQNKLSNLDPSTQQDEIAAVERIISVAQRDIRNNTEQIAALENLAITNPAVSEFSKLSPEEQEASILAEVNENYLPQKQTFDAINNPSVSDLQTEVSADEEIIESLQNKLSNLDPSTQQVEIAAVERIISVAQSDIRDNAEQIAALENLAISNPTENAFAQLSLDEQEEQILNGLNENYLESKTAFYTKTNPTVEELETIIATDENMVESLNAELSNIDPNTQKVELAAIERILATTEAGIVINSANLKEKEMANQIALVTLTETNGELIDRISADYTNEVAEIENNNNLSELERMQTLVDLDQNLMTDLEIESSKVEELVQQNPSNVKLINKANQLNEIISEKQQILASREVEVATLESQVAVTNPATNTNTFAALTAQEQEDQIRENMDWSYDDEKTQIAQSSTNEEEKLNALIALDKSTQNKLAEEKAQLDPLTQKEEKKAIERLELALKTSLTNNQLSKLALPETSEALISRIESSYYEQKSAIEQNNALSPKDKLEQMIALDENLVSSLEAEKDQYDRLNADANLPVLTEKSNEIATYIASEKSNIASLQSELDAIENQVATTDPIENPIPQNNFATLSYEEQDAAILTKINASYKANRTKIENAGLENKENVEKLVALNKKVLTQLSAEKAKQNNQTNLAEIAAIERLEYDLQRVVVSNENTLRTFPETKEELMTRVAHNEVQALDALADQTELTEIEKTEKSIEIRKDILVALENEYDVLNELSNGDATNEKLKEKKAEINQVIISSQNDLSIVEDKLTALNEALAATNTSPTNTQAYKNINEIRSDILKDARIMEEDETTLSALRVQLENLKTYETDLLALDSNYQYLETVKGENRKKERKLIGEELAEVGKRKRVAMITIGELETEVENANTVASSVAVYDDPGLKRIVDEENELRVQLDAEVSMKQARKIEKKLIEKIDERSEKENDLTQKVVDQTKKENVDKLTQLKALESNTVTERVSLELTENKFNEIQEEVAALERKAKNASTPQEEAELLSQALDKQMEASEMLETSYMDAKVERLTKGKINSLMTNAELQSKRKNMLLEEANIKAQIAAIDDQIKIATKAKEEDRLYEERQALDEKRTKIVNSIAQLDRKISDSPKKGKETLPATAIEKELTYMDERKIAESKEYKELSTATYDALFLEREINFLLKSIDNDKAEAQKLVQQTFEKPSDEIDLLVLNKVKSIEEKQIRLDDLKLKLAKRQTEIGTLLPRDVEMLANVNNMLSRGVDPMSKYDQVEFIAIPKDGFSIQAPTAPKTVKAKPIMAETPTGLMYRVQVGAFSKPVSEDVFNEFTPVSAEKRSNGILVYMAGYFNGNGKAFEAQKSIRKIGYSDAFVVAYCDGKRITLSEAKRLEETNACTPIQVSEIALRADAPKDTTKVMITELDYYKGIGAAPALPVETKKGLFYTVQLGVYNRPVGKEVLKKMSPLITKRLPNGQIRYSAGVYVSIEEAFPKRAQAHERGIGDAYITAYYGGERITLAEAEKLLQTEGANIIEKTAIGIVKNVESRLAVEQKLANDIQEIVNNKKVEGMKIQLVSKKQFDEFPRDILNRFNSHASFYFDINDKRIKSNLFETVEDIPQMYFLRNEIDTTFISDMQRIKKVKENDLRNLTFEISSAQLGGDLTDLLLRLNYRKEFIQVGEVIQVRVHEIPTENVQAISDRLRILKIRSEVEDPAR